MSNKKNHQREGKGNVKRTETGPRYENGNPGAGCNSTHVARSRRKWKKHRNRSLRRTGETSSKCLGRHVVHPEIDVATAWALAEEMDLPDGATIAVFEELSGRNIGDCLDELGFEPEE